MRRFLSAAISLLPFVLLIPVSCSPAAQEQFNRPVAMLHSFPGTNKAFTAVSERMAVPSTRPLSRLRPERS